MQAYVFSYMFPDLFSPESLELKEATVDCTRKEVFRTNLIQSYIDEDWQSFAKKCAHAEFVFQLFFVILVMIQFWQVSLETAIASNDSLIRSVLVPFLTIIFLVINILKELGQISIEGKKYFLNSEGKKYLPNFENIIDLIISALVIVCQYFYWCKGKIVNGYYIPEDGTFSDD